MFDHITMIINRSKKWPSSSTFDFDRSLLPVIMSHNALHDPYLLEKQFEKKNVYRGSYPFFSITNRRQYVRKDYCRILNQPNRCDFASGNGSKRQTFE